jgi:hypothetical protein
MGLVKLWWTNRYLRKQELIDEEKRHRIKEMQKTGLSLKKGMEIPFGVRAIQGGVEVDGIWISRPTTPATPITPTSASKPGSTTTLAGEHIGVGKGKSRLSDPDNNSLAFEKAVGAQVIDLPPVTPMLQKGSYQPKQPSRNRDSRQADALRQLEGRPTRKVDTYVPSSAQISEDSGGLDGTGSNTSSEYGGEGRDGPYPRPLDTSPRPDHERTPSRDLLKPNIQQNGYTPAYQTSPQPSLVNPFATPAMTPVIEGTEFPSPPATEQQTLMSTSVHLQKPKPTFGVGESRTRRLSQDLDPIPLHSPNPQDIPEFRITHSSDDMDLESQVHSTRHSGNGSRPGLPRMNTLGGEDDV